MIGAARYFARRYFAARYWPKASSGVSFDPARVTALASLVPLRRLASLVPTRRLTVVED